ncbi:biotin--[acetyl-CoA-carboxylase] ligase [Aminipila luticellarii]|uniref:Bifunctional ligase/repressor BirA n=1 Tax=Aminipila luticellarii TaxID=2507160 RepID=A0A410PXD4_9FIRM|nr:biotin--[acetyl-CoA-carboxylase] ligase [Aminipila luticellarii]QAT43589.1 biotin--[acetyl-CoA-carboxylase] ligase [Aminipila luticellarii]
MSVKDEVLKVLEKNKGESISGEALANQLGVSRAAVWKAMTVLRKEGYPIMAATNKGYSLMESSDLLSEQGIRVYLKEKDYALNLHVYKSIDSTNLEAKRLALEGAGPGTIIVSNEQTKGRGRLGRSFYSPASSGIYLTILLKPGLDLSQSVLVTTAASVAVARAIQKVAHVEPQIKWVNDVYIANKKVCGILTEAITDFETGTIEYIALGIGINCRTPELGFPEDIITKAGAIEVPFSRNELAAEVIHQVMSLYENIESRSFIEEYKRRSMVLGKNIEVVKHYQKESVSENPEAQSAVALDIDKDGGLVVEYEDGTREVLNTGEISIKL